MLPSLKSLPFSKIQISNDSFYLNILEFQIKGLKLTNNIIKKYAITLTSRRIVYIINTNTELYWLEQKFQLRKYFESLDISNGL